MEKDIIFIKLSNFESKKTGERYYQVEYLIVDDDVTYRKDFIDKNLFDLLISSDISFLKKYKGEFTFDKFMRAKLEMIL